MLYYLIEYLDRLYDPPGFQVVQFITVRAALAAVTALFIALFLGKRIIRWLRAQQLGERVRDDVIVSHAHKAGTPTMGGVIILLSILGATLLWGALQEVYVWLIVLATAWMGAFGFADDYIKTVKQDKRGLAPRIKVVGQVTLGILVGAVLYFHPEFAEVRSVTYLPFIRDGFIDYAVPGTIGPVDLTWLLYIGVSVFIITALSNSVNITDGLDGLATGVTAFVSLGLLALTYIAGNVVLANFLNSIYLPGAGELAVFAAAMAAACFGFLWYNGFPASVFMGDTGSLALGAAVGATMLMIRKELLLPLLGLVYLVEAGSVIIQTGYFKYSRWRTGKGQRVFRMAPLHHHYEAKGEHEAKIVLRFWIIAALAVIATLLVLRIR
ncbi:MAG: phospho-N-acetylmuramoyl-pentapeptide-transferase [Bacteroidetes bacterium]|jgi:phospho-N-acetylmuramoyl-pentapeptide-transferase|nr:phospho-N-acetylmuramoyl-pentapeptide-transferase [Bacteroidota bacterium]